MKNLFPKSPIADILSVKEKQVLLFTPITEEMNTLLSGELTRYMQFPKLSEKRKELNNELYKHHKLTFDNIVAIGNTDIETRLANTYIENNVFETGDTGKTRIKKRNYKCFVNKDWKDPKNKMNLPYHEDGGCAWNCLMGKLGNPTFGVIYLVYTTDLKHFTDETVE